jgi:hypothetical protein
VTPAPRKASGGQGFKYGPLVDPGSTGGLLFDRIAVPDTRAATNGRIFTWMKFI